jgi:predicted nuclease of restriction endonuclease-like (RecB) superfamily
MPLESLPKDYPRFLNGLKERIRAGRFKAALSANRELIAMYWDLGRQVVERQKRGSWGMNVIERAAQDLRDEFPEMSGLSARNIWRMRAFYRAWAGADAILARPERELGASILPRPVAELPWRHNVALLEKLKIPQERLWYARQALRNGWPRDVLVRHIRDGLHLRQGNAQTNFGLTLPAPQAKLAQETLKEEYALDFLPAGVTQEKDIEQGIIENAQRFLLELGKGFAFVGRQQRLEANGREHVVDLLLYNVILHSYVVIELKAGPFKSEHAGKLSSYLSAADALLRRDGDQASIGVILCRSKNRIVVEYALRDQRRPIGVACYRLTRELPSPLRKRFPTARALEAELSAAPYSRKPKKRPASPESSTPITGSEPR